MDPKYIIVHCSDSTWGNAAVIDEWHKERGFNRKGKVNVALKHIGYHRVILNGRISAKSSYDIRRDGFIECGRDLDEVGAHCLGMNDSSLGICLIGKSKFTELQMLALLNELAFQCTKFNLRANKVMGHYETGSGHEQGKTCPNLDMKSIRSKLMLRGL